MAWGYCCNCDGELGEPTPQEIVEDNRSCPHCDADISPNKSIGELILELLERIVALEEKQNG